MLIDGLLIGVAFLTTSKTGIIITVALVVETLFVSLAAVSILPDDLSVYKILTVPFLFGTFLLVGITSGIVFFAGLTVYYSHNSGN